MWPLYCEGLCQLFPICPMLFKHICAGLYRSLQEFCVEQRPSGNLILPLLFCFHLTPFSFYEKVSSKYGWNFLKRYRYMAISTFISLLGEAWTQIPVMSTKLRPPKRVTVERIVCGCADESLISICWSILWLLNLFLILNNGIVLPWRELWIKFKEDYYHKFAIYKF